MQFASLLPASTRHPLVWETEDADFIITPCGRGYIAVYRGEWPGEDGREIGEGDTPYLAIADLVIHYPREV